MVSSSLEFSIATWNILSDQLRHKGVPPQTERLASFVEALKLAQPTGFDVLHLCEVELGQDDSGSVDALVEALQPDDYSVAAHPIQSDGLMMTVKSPWNKPQAAVLDPEHVGLPAISSVLGNIAVVGTHLSHEFSKTRWRIAQMNAARRLAPAPSQIGEPIKPILVGDWNGFNFMQPRLGLTRSGYTSVMSELGYPISFPTPEYRWQTLKWYQHPLVRRGYSLDDIYLPPGTEIKDAGRLRGEGDHWGVWVKARCKLAVSLQSLNILPHTYTGKGMEPDQQRQAI